eukprot:scaffold310208_cov19-Tisochrysis_lutea.AAC.1
MPGMYRRPACATAAICVHKWCVPGPAHRQTQLIDAAVIYVHQWCVPGPADRQMQLKDAEVWLGSLLWLQTPHNANACVHSCTYRPSL